MLQVDSKVIYLSINDKPFSYRKIGDDTPTREHFLEDLYKLINAADLVIYTNIKGEKFVMKSRY